MIVWKTTADDTNSACFQIYSILYFHKSKGFEHMSTAIRA